MRFAYDASEPTVHLFPRVEEYGVKARSMSRGLVSNWDIAMFRKADSNANPFEGLMDSDHKISVPRDPVD